MTDEIQAARRALFQNARGEVAGLRAFAAKLPNEADRGALEGTARRLDLAIDLLRHCEIVCPTTHLVA